MTWKQPTDICEHVVASFCFVSHINEQGKAKSCGSFSQLAAAAAAAAAIKNWSLSTHARQRFLCFTRHDIRYLLLFRFF
jgi:hypothetical protein